MASIEPSWMSTTERGFMSRWVRSAWRCRRRLAAEPLEAERHRADDDLAHAQDADEPRDRDGADADRLDEGAEDLRPRSSGAMWKVLPVW